MSDPKPREWWIRPEASYNGEFIFDEDPTSYWPMTKGECVHVIEHSAVQALEQLLTETFNKNSVSQCVHELLVKELEAEVADALKFQDIYAEQLTRERKVTAILEAALDRIKSGGGRAEILGLDMSRCPTCASAEIASEALAEAARIRGGE